MPLPDDVVQTFPEEIRGEATLQKFNDVGAIAKSYIELEKMNGNSIRLPAKDAKPEDLQKWRDEQGPKLMPHLPTLGFDLPPPSPDKYDLKVPEGFDKNLEKGFRETAHKLGLPASKVQGILDFYQAQTQEQMKSMMWTPEMAEREAREIVGADYDSVMAHASAGLENLKAANPGLGDFFEKSLLVETLPDGSKRVYPLGKHPNMIGLLEQIGELTAADQGGTAGRTGGSVDTTADDAEKEALDIINNKDNPKHKIYHGQSSPAKTEMREYVNRLLAKKHPGEQQV